MDGANLLEGFHVEVLLVAQDDVAVGLLGHGALLKVDHVLEGHAGQRLVDLLVEVVIDTLEAGFEIGVDDTKLGDSVACQLLGESLLGQVERLVALRDGVEYLVEGAYAVHHLVVLRDDIGNSVLWMSGLWRVVVERAGAVCQSACLAQLLEDYGVHASAEVLVEEGAYCCLVGVPRLVLIVIHYEIDVLGVVGRNPHLVLWSGLLHVVAVLERLSHLLGSGVLLVDDGCEVLDAAWAIVEYLVLVSGQCLDEVDQGLWVGGAHLVNAHPVELAVVLAILSQGAQGAEVGALVLLAVFAVFDIEAYHVVIGLLVGLGVVHHVLGYGERLGQVLVQTADDEAQVVCTHAEAGLASQLVQLLVDVGQRLALGTDVAEVVCGNGVAVVGR